RIHAEMVAKVSFRIKHKRLRNAYNFEVSIGVAAFVESDAQGDRVLRQKSRHRIRWFVGDGEDFEILCELFGEVFERRHFGAARPAPGSPEVHQHHLSAKALQADWRAIETWQREIISRLERAFERIQSETIAHRRQGGRSFDV